MKSKSSRSTAGLECEVYQARLAGYVSEELNNQAVERLYPDIAFHLESCENCATVYNREFRRQGRQKTLPELQQIGDRAQVEAAMRQILSPSRPNPAWSQVVLEHGRAWLEQETGRYRQLWLSLAALGNLPGRTPAPAGMMGPDSASSDVLGQLDMTFPAANVEIKLVLLADSTTTGEDHCRVDLVLTLKDHFGDFSGVQVTLLWDDASPQVKKTDALGKVSFTGLPCYQLPVMSLEIVLPD
jgi:hypothetical protein